MSIGPKVARLIGLNVNKNRNHLGMGCADFCLNPTSDGVAITYGASGVDLKMEIDLEPVTEATSTKSVEASHSWYRQDVLREVLEHGLSWCTIQEVVHRTFE